LSLVALFLKPSSNAIPENTVFPNIVFPNIVFRNTVFRNTVPNNAVGAKCYVVFCYPTTKFEALLKRRFLRDQKSVRQQRSHLREITLWLLAVRGVAGRNFIDDRRLF